MKNLASLYAPKNDLLNVLIVMARSYSGLKGLMNQLEKANNPQGFMEVTLAKATEGTDKTIHGYMVALSLARVSAPPGYDMLEFGQGQPVNFGLPVGGWQSMGRCLFLLQETFDLFKRAALANANLTPKGTAALDALIADLKAVRQRWKEMMIAAAVPEEPQELPDMESATAVEISELLRSMGLHRDQHGQA